MKLEDLLLRINGDTLLRLFDIETGGCVFFDRSSKVSRRFNNYYVETVGTLGGTLSVSIVKLDDVLQSTTCF